MYVSAMTADDSADFAVRHRTEKKCTFISFHGHKRINITQIWGGVSFKGPGEQGFNKKLSPGDPTAATREPDSASHEHHNAFFPGSGRGTAFTAGFGWRGGSGV